MSNPFSDLKSLVDKFDLKRIRELAKKVDLVKIVGLLTQADSEALYSYEGTKQVNSLIVGRAVTGFSAFV